MSLKVKSNGINFNVPTIENLPTERLEEGLVCVVTDENRGGVFVYREANALVNNGGTIFNGWTRQYDGAVDVKWFGAKGDGVTDDTVAIQNALNSDARIIYLDKGYYLISVHDSSSATAALTSTLDNRVFYGEGKLTANAQIKVLLTIYGDNNLISINIEGNNNIGNALIIYGKNPTIENCIIENLNGFTDWGSIGIRLNYKNVNYGATIRNNTIRNLQGVGDIYTGAGLNRAILVDSNQECSENIYIYNNIIETIEGREGDSIAIISSVLGTYYRMPVIIRNNYFNIWSRRAVKIQAYGVLVDSNTFKNDLDIKPSSLQRVVDIVQGGDNTVVNNLFDTCRFQGQIGMFISRDETPVDNITVKNNTIIGLGAETDATLIQLQTYGSNAIIEGNTIICPNSASTAIWAVAVVDGIVANNTIITNTSPWFNFTNSTGLKIYNNYHNSLNAFSNMYSDLNTSETVLNTGVDRRITLYCRDIFLSDGEIINAISSKSGDKPATSEIQFVATGTNTATSKIVFATGSSSNPKVARMEINQYGHLWPSIDNVSTLGWTNYRFSTIYAGTGTINTSDAREKTFSNIPEVEKQVANELKGLMRRFKFNDAIEAKGIDKARIHYGASAQEVIAVFEKYGLDAMQYAMVCYDEWEETPEVKDEEGNVTQEYRPAGNRYGIRYEELLCFIISAL